MFCFILGSSLHLRFFVVLTPPIYYNLNDNSKSYGGPQVHGNKIISRQNKRNSRQNKINSRQNKINSRQNIFNSRQNKITHGKTKLTHGKTKLTHGKTKLTHVKTKLTHGKTKLTHGKIKRRSWSAVVLSLEMVRRVSVVYVVNTRLARKPPFPGQLSRDVLQHLWIRS